MGFTPSAPGPAPDQTCGFTPAADPPGHLSTVNPPPSHTPRSGFGSRSGRTSWARSADGAPLDPDTLVGPYELLDELGKGGMGVVHRARHTSLNRVVALKMILAGPGAGGQHLERFLLEAEAVARLHHPGIVQVYDVGDHAGRPYMAMELIDGGSLADKIDGKPQNPRQSAQMTETLARAVAVAHAAHIVHRDLKPGNVLLTRDGQPKITDFGLAKDLDREDGSHTRAGSILGTPSYMAPEQAAGRVGDIGPGTDVYALGAILYEMLTGRPPFRGESPIDTIRQVLDGEVLPPHNLAPKIPRDLDTICLKALQKPVHRRYATALEMAEDLRRFLDGEPIRARPVGPRERAVKWVRRHPTTASLLLVGAATLAGFIGLGVWSYRAVTARAHEAEEARGRADDALAEGTRRLVRLNVANGSRVLDDGDLLGSVLWFAEALRLDPGGDDRARMHRVRLKAVSDRCPRLGQVWLHEAALTEAVFDGAGRVVLTASDDGTARSWDAATGGPAGPPLEHGGPVKVAALSPDGRTALTAGTEPFFRLWDVPTGKLLATPATGTQMLRALFSPDGDRLLTGGTGGRPRVWDPRTGAEQVSALPGVFAGKIVALAWLPGGARFVAGGTDGTARVFDAATAAPVGPPLRHGGPVLGVAAHPAGGKVASASADGTVQVWDAATGAAQLAAPPRHPDAVNAVSFSPDGGKLLTASDDRTAQVWDAATGLPVGRPAQHGSRVHVASFGPAGRYFVTGSDDNTARIWDGTTGDPTGPPFRHTATPIAVRFSPAGHQLLCAATNRIARLWDLIPLVDLADPPPAHAAAAGGGSGVRSATSPDGRLVVTFGGGQAVRVRRASDFEPVTPPLRTGAGVSAAVFRPDGAVVLTGDEEGGVQVWGAADGKPLWEAPGRHASRVGAVAFTADGGRVATGSDDNTARVWDAVTGKPVVPPVRLGSTGAGVEFGADGRTLYVVTDGRQARVFDAGTGEPLTPVFAARADWAAGLVPTDWPAADLLALGRVLAGQAVTDAGDLVPAESRALRDEWRTLRAKYPAVFAPDPAAVKVWYGRQATAAEAAGQWFAAAWQLDRLLADSPDDADLRRRRAAAAAKLGDWKRAAADAGAAVLLQPDRADGWYQRGVAGGRLGEWDRAAADLAKAVELRADPDAAVGLAARVKLDAGDAAGYRRLTKELADGFAAGDPAPRAARAAAWACALSPATGADLGVVLRLAEKAAAAAPADPAAAATLGLALLRVGRADEAATRLQPVCAAADDRPAAWAAYALALAKQGKPAEAKEWRDKAAGCLGGGRAGVPPGWDARCDAGALLREADGR